MPGITEAREKVVTFCKKELGRTAEQIRLLKVSKSSEGWNSKVEITEVNEYLKKMGYPTVFDKNLYDVRLDTNLDVVGFCREGLETEEEE